MSSTVSGMPAGQPSTTAPKAGPWDSPQVVTAKFLPKLDPDTMFTLSACGRRVPFSTASPGGCRRGFQGHQRSACPWKVHGSGLLLKGLLGCCTDREAGTDNVLTLFLIIALFASVFNFFACAVGLGTEVKGWKRQRHRLPQEPFPENTVPAASLWNANH